MKRTVTIRLNGKAHTLCYTVRTVRAVTEKFGSPEKMDEVITQSPSAIERTESLIFVLHALILSGARFCILNGIDNPPPLSIDEVRAMYPLLNGNAVYELIKTVISAGSALSVDISQKPAKGRKAAPKLKPTVDRYLWYGLHMGLSYTETLDIPLGQLLSLVNEEQIQQGTAEVKYHNSDEDPFPDWE